MLVSQNEHVPHAQAQKKYKPRITVALCSNTDGTDKVQPLVITKSARPQCFPKTFDVQSVVQYHHNTKAWMTAVVFMKWLKCHERRKAAKKHHIFPLLDNAPSIIHHLDIIYVCIEMLSPNTTYHIQPMDAGIIRNFKLHYKTKLTQQYIREVDEKVSFERINLKQAVYFVKDAWAMVTDQRITNCFSHWNHANQQSQPTIPTLHNQLNQISNKKHRGSYRTCRNCFHWQPFNPQLVP